jgi:cation diffusion facilitator family transporter
VWAGYPLADPIAGLLISAAIFVLVWQSARSVLVRMLDGVASDTLEAISHAGSHVPRVEEVTDVRARWIGHRLHAELSVTVATDLSVREGHEVAREVRHQLLHHVPHLGGVTVHVDPVGQGGERHHRIGEHAHDGLPVHVHD